MCVEEVATMKTPPLLHMRISLLGAQRHHPDQTQEYLRVSNK
jgi:hypothetical protein